MVPGDIRPLTGRTVLFEPVGDGAAVFLGPRDAVVVVAELPGRVVVVLARGRCGRVFAEALER